MNERACKKCGAMALGEQDLCSFCKRSSGDAASRCTRCGAALQAKEKGPLCSGCAYVGEASVGQLCVVCASPVMKPGALRCRLCAETPLKGRGAAKVFGGMTGMVVNTIVAGACGYFGYVCFKNGLGNSSSLGQYVGYVMFALSLLTFWQVWRSYKGMF